MDAEGMGKFGLLAVLCWAAAAFAGGAALSWWAFGAPRGVDLAADNGNTADWVAAVFGAIAAIGTCVIGFAANSYTKAQADTGRDKERRQNAVHIRHMRLWAEMLQRPDISMTKFVNGELENVVVNMSGACGHIAGIAGVISNVSWADSAWSVLGPEEVDARVDAMGKTRLVIDGCENFLKWNNDWNVKFDAEKTDGVDAIRNMFRMLRASGERLEAAIDRAEERLRHSGELHKTP